MGWKILLPQEIMSEGRKLLEDAGHELIMGRGFETEDVLAEGVLSAGGLLPGRL